MGVAIHKIIDLYEIDTKTGNVKVYFNFYPSVLYFFFFLCVCVCACVNVAFFLCVCVFFYVCLMVGCLNHIVILDRGKPRTRYVRELLPAFDMHKYVVSSADMGMDRFSGKFLTLLSVKQEMICSQVVV